MYALICTLRPLYQGFCIQEFSNTAFQVAPGFEWAEVESEVDTHEFCGVEVEGVWTIQPIARPAVSKWRCELVIQEELDKKAGEWGYTSSPGVGSMYSAATYLGSAVAKYRTEAETLVAWRDSVWEWAEAVLAEFDSPEFVPGFNEAEFRAMVPAAPARPVP